MRFVYFGIYDPDFSRNRIYISALKRAGHTVTDCSERSRGPGKYVRLAARLVRLRGGYDAVIVGYPGHVAVPIAWLCARAPVIADLLGSLSDAVEQSHGGRLSTKIRLSLIDRLAVWLSDTVLVESEAQRTYMSARFGSAHKYAVLYSGCDEGVFAPRPYRAESRERCVVLFRGRLTPESGIMHILDAAEQLREESSIRFRIIGYGRLLDAVKKRLAESRLTNVELISEHVTFERLRELMLDATVSLGQFENNVRLQRTIPHKMFESMCMGIPYITARSPAASEIIEDGASALMVPQGSGEAIAKAIVRLSGNPVERARLSNNARDVYMARVSGSKIADTLAGIARRLSVRGMSRLRELSIILLILSAFIALRAPGLDLPYHQDEWKNAEMVRIGMEGGLSAHPPLMELIYRWSGAVFGAGNLRMMPLVFGVLSAALLYIVVRRRAGISAALIATGLYTISAFCVLASLMLDMDGTILPFFFLGAVYAYDRFRDASSRAAVIGWLAATVAVVLLGFLIKLSFIIVVGALVLDYVLHEWRRLTRRTLAYGALGLALCAGMLAASLWGARFVIPSFDVSVTISHALWYVRFEGRAYTQILIQTAKALFYLSPVLLLAPLFLTKDGLKKSSVFFVYLGVGIVFYYILLDFSQGALDKYLMYAIAPLSAIAGVAMAARLSPVSRRDATRGLLLGGVLSIALISAMFLPHSVMPLYPKTEWLSAVLSGRWSILMPFTGGNGPLGFYMSFLAISSAYIASAALVAVALLYERWRKSALVAVIAVSLVLNGLFIEELLFGRISGSAPVALRAAIQYVQGVGSPKVLTHADAGAYELSAIGAYGGRFYAVPGYEEGHRALFAKHNGMFVVVDMPRLNEAGFYSRYFATCATKFKTSSVAIDAYVYDCAGSDPYAIK